MTKNEFMAKLTDELKKRNIEDAADVAEEYEQHFAFKLADGYSEEIAAKLGDPTALAAQFDAAAQGGEKRSAVLTWLWLWLADFVFGMASVLLLAFGVVLAACVLSFGLTGVCLIFDLGRLPFVSLPAMPYWCGAILGVSLLALAVLSVVGCIWFFAFVRQIWRAYGRFHHNALAPSHGAAVLPELPIALLLFAVCFVLAFAVCALSAGSFQFWHVWGWFGHGA